MRKAWYPYTHPFNLSGNPAVTVPCGWASDGLPVGLQLVGPHLGDARLLRAAALFEMARPWADRTPPPLCSRWRCCSALRSILQRAGGRS